MIHLKNSGYMPHDSSILLKKADELTSGLDAVIRDTRVSKKFLEFDVSIPKEQLDLLLLKLESIGNLDEARCLVEEKIEKEEAVENGKFYFNNERFWECHEVLEGAWKKTYEGEKDLIQGIILVAAAFVHYQKNENDICLSIMNRAMEKLQNSAGVYYDINVDEFKRKTSEIIKTGKIATFTI
ncbi:Uncharacterised protein [uncultured archaeon]|nr:Uncharacterised protein [uncultured archaeon]